MRVFADESVEQSIVVQLRQEGHDVGYAADLMPGAPDDLVLRHANDRKALLLTADKDFGELVFRQRRVHHGVVLLRLAGLLATAKADLVVDALRRHADEVEGAFAVVSHHAVRIRTAPEEGDGA